MMQIRLMSAADVPFGMHLKEQAGWNQTPGDWRRCLALQPDGCFVAEWHGTPVGTTTTCIFGNVAWVAMVLVEVNQRGRGIGKALMNRALVYLDKAGVVSVRLDATPLGQPLYEKLGFHAQFTLARFAGVPEVRDPPKGVRSVLPARWHQLSQLDAAATGTARGKLLECLFAESPDSWRCVERADSIAGFLAARQGSRAIQIGPCIADACAGSLLLADACHRFAGHSAYLDVPTGNETAMEFCHSQGMTIQRHLTRMCRGPDVQEDIARLWASSGPEKG